MSRLAIENESMKARRILISAYAPSAENTKPLPGQVLPTASSLLRVYKTAATLTERQPRRGFPSKLPISLSCWSSRFTPYRIRHKSVAPQCLFNRENQVGRQMAFGDVAHGAG